MLWRQFWQDIVVQHEHVARQVAYLILLARLQAADAPRNVARESQHAGEIQRLAPHDLNNRDARIGISLAKRPAKRG